MSVGMSQHPVVFTEGQPILNVKNVTESLDYYCIRLGFQVVFQWSQEDTPPWTFAQVRRGNFLVYLCQGAQGGSGMWMYLNLATLADLAALYQEYQAKNVKITEPPTDQSWGMREDTSPKIPGSPGILLITGKSPPPSCCLVR
jgi:uncharacterized glyoxalase superfamily protein PhnB